MDDSEDEVNLSRLLEQSRSGPNDGALEDLRFQNYQQNIPWMGYSDKYKTHYGANAMSNVSTAGKNSDKRWTMPWIVRNHAAGGRRNDNSVSNMTACVPISREMHAMYASEEQTGNDELSNLSADNPFKTREVQGGNKTDGRTVVDAHRWEERFHGKVNASVDRQTQNSKADMKDNIRGLVQSGHSNECSTLKSIEEEGNARGRRLSRYGRGRHSTHRSGNIKMDKSTERLNYCQHYRPTLNEKVAADISKESTPDYAQSIKYIGESRNKKSGNDKVSAAFSNQETSSTTMNEQVRSLLEDDPDQLCKELANQKNWLTQLIKVSCNDHELLKNVIALLQIALSSRYSQQTGYALIIVLKDTCFFELIIVPFLSSLLLEESRDWSPYVSVLKNIVGLVIIFLTRTPTSLVLIFGLLDILQRIVDNFHEIETSDTSLQMIKDGIMEIQALKEIQVSKGMTKSANHGVSGALLHENEEPLENFRNLRVCPQLEEIKTEKPPFLRMNKETGAYRDLEHYLDVQYRLLREDFIGPLREGIHEYRQNISTKMKKLQDLRLYYDVKIQQLAPGRDGIYHQLKFDISRLRHVEWAHSKRLIYGSFLCLSADDFDTVLFATVADRDPQKLRSGIVDVLFQSDLMDVMKRSQQTFIMAETTAFFEAYKHVLFALQNVVRLPFQKHLVNCEKDVHPPAYLTETNNTFYDLAPLLDRSMVISRWGCYRMAGLQNLGNRGRRYVRVTNLTEWPSEKDIGLDRSQYKAIQTALTCRLSITQGPPGTGKTYIGLQIVRVLLHNKHVWERGPLDFDGSPMLVVCYTNHALDQFLEGILKFYNGDVVRVGGRSSSKALGAHHLDKFRERVREDRLVPWDIRKHRNRARMLMNCYMMELKTKAEALEQARQQILLTEQELNPYMWKHYDSLILGFMKTLWNKKNVDMLAEVTTKQRQSWVIEEWLGCGSLMPTTNAVFYLQQNMNDLDEYINDTTEDAEDSINTVSEDLYVNITDVADTLEGDRMTRDDEDDFAFETCLNTTTQRTNLCGFRPPNQFNKIETGMEKLEHDEKQEQYGFWNISKADQKKRKEEFRKQLNETSVMEESQVRDTIDVWELDHRDRWRLYRYWRQRYLNTLETNISWIAKLYKNAVKEYKEAKMLEDQFVLQRANIIGMTTTCAARYQSVLHKIGPRIIIVEEAAEVLESHIIATLSEHCQHLILIGDHEQLRPNPTVYTLAKDYKLDISLFERMVNNEIQCDCLEEQHRMRPEISMLLRHIYPKLRDHVSVSEYENIKGVGSNIFFIDHTHEESLDTDQTSHLNEHEARYIVALCKYLLQQSYSPNQITVLTTYSGQLFCLRQMMPKKDFEGVTVTAVDNYQGEENDIILLSLVRSNHEGKIGFLKISNRICVALSRAKKGFYVIGNFDFLTRHSKLWTDIVQTLKAEGKIGKTLALHCQDHPNVGFHAADADDFRKFAPEGGCQRNCESRLACGHSCIRLCHPDDRNHEQYRCKKPCEKICENEHSCKKLCYQDCNCPILMEKTMPECNHVQSIPCGMFPAAYRCKFPVSYALQNCGHMVILECWQNPIEVNCPVPCEKILTCGHVCQRDCGEEHTNICQEIIEDTLECGHKSYLQCYRLRSKVICKEQCSRVLNCGHTCRKICGEKHDHDRSCEQMVTKIIPGCKHSVQALCNRPESSLHCNRTVEISFDCGHTSTARCGEETTEKCNFLMEKTFECGHTSNVSCHKLTSVHCQVKCKGSLACGHKCSGDCTECHKGRLHKRCSESNVEVLICGHTCKAPCSSCPPCARKCDHKCHHKECNKVCFEVCEPCVEPCSWKCAHFRCSKTCSEICDRPPCNEPCLMRLICKHPCIGLCGEPCPNLCRVCDREKVTKSRYGKENHLNARFVELQDCGDVVEVTAMDRWVQSQLQQGDVSEIRFLTCPCCRTSIRNSVRYQRELKNIRKAIGEVKLKLCISEKKNLPAKDELISKIEMLDSRFRMKSKVGFEKQLSKAFECSVKTFKNWISKQNDDVTPQQQLDIRDEVTRLQMMLKLMIFSQESLKGDIQLTEHLRVALETARTALLSKERLGERRMDIESCLKKLARLSTSTALDESVIVYNTIMEVRKEWSRASWIKCAAGHVFHKAELTDGTCTWCVPGDIIV